MPIKSLVRVFVALIATLSLSSPVFAKDACGGAKTKAECGKKSSCQWSKTACVAKVAAKPAAKSAAKPAVKGKAVAKPTTKAGAKPAGKAAAKKPAAAPAPAADPADVVPNEEPVDTEDMGGEEEDF
jgi:hypothetical protein